VKVEIDRSLFDTPKPLFWRLRFEPAAGGQSGDHLGDCPALGALGPALADRAHIPVANPGGPDLETALGQLEHFHFGPVA